MTITTKFAIGQTVHFRSLGAPNAGKIIMVRATATAAGVTVEYECESFGKRIVLAEQEIYPSRKALMGCL
jgi:hypothetical protein